MEGLVTLTSGGLSSLASLSLRSLRVFKLDTSEKFCQTSRVDPALSVDWTDLRFRTIELDFCHGSHSQVPPSVCRPFTQCRSVTRARKGLWFSLGTNLSPR